MRDKVFKGIAIIAILFIFVLLINYLLAFIGSASRWFQAVQVEGAEASMSFPMPGLDALFNFRLDLIMVYVILLLGFCGLVFMSTLNFKSNTLAVNQNQYGDARWATLKELKKQYRSIPEKKVSYSGKGGIPISRYDTKILIDDGAVNNLYIGTTRSGKGEGYVIPTIDIYSRATEQASMVLNDAKGELYAASKDTLRARGYEVHALNLLDPDMSMSYNPLQLAIDAYKESTLSDQKILDLCRSGKITDPKIKECVEVLDAENKQKKEDQENQKSDKAQEVDWSEKEIFIDRSLFRVFKKILLTARNSNEGISFFKKKASKNRGKLTKEMIPSVIDAYRAGRKGDAELLVNTIAFSLYNDPSAKDKFWQEASIGLFNGVALALIADSISLEREDLITLYNISNFVAVNGKTDARGNSPLDAFFSKRDNNDPARMQYAIVQFAPPQTRGSVLSSFQSKLLPFSRQKNAKMTSRNSLDLESIGFGDKPVAVFMVVPDFDSSNHALASIFISQLYFVLAKKASISIGNKCAREVIFVLDEAGNMTPIPDLATIMTVCLGRGIRFNLYIQAYSQLTALYGKENATTIIGNCGNQVYILTAENETAEHFSKLLGKKTITDVSKSGKKYTMDRSHSESAKEQPLLAADRLLKIKEEESVVFRPIKRQDVKRQKITSDPIFNTDKTSMKYRWRYLADDFDTSRAMEEVAEYGEHIDLNLKNVLFSTLVERYSLVCEKIERDDLETITQIFKTVLESRNSSAEFVNKFTKDLRTNMTIELLRRYAQLLKEQYYKEVVRHLEPFYFESELEQLKKDEKRVNFINESTKKFTHIQTKKKAPATSEHNGSKSAYSYAKAQNSDSDE